ncbi:MAG: c-type cytochrome [Planctomycetes bacterium]|nr:c-type cytochrome [Planctomycetota bacterium]
MATSARAAEPAGENLAGDAHLRRPVAAAFLHGQRTIAVANARSGSLSLLDAATGQVQRETTVAESLSSLVAIDDEHVVVADQDAGRLYLLRVTADGIERRTEAIVENPARLAWHARQHCLAVATLWSRRIEFYHFERDSVDGASLVCNKRDITLPFAPRCLTWSPDGRWLVVADAFGPNLAVIEAERGKLHAVRQIRGHNLAGLAFDHAGRNVLVTHQRLDQHAPILPDNLATGTLMDNFLSVVALDDLLDVKARGSLRTFELRLGMPDDGAGDPAEVAVLDERRLAISLAGTNQVATVIDLHEVSMRINVGARPGALLVADKGGRLFVVNRLDDSLGAVDWRGEKLLAEWSLGPRGSEYPRDRGERLFYDARLSPDRWMSCHSCHTEGHTGGLLADTLGDETFGTPKRTPTLLGTSITDPWNWSGSLRELRDQVRKSFDTTMHAPHVTVEQVDDVVAFLHTLRRPPPLEPPRDDTDRAQIARGRAVFDARGCAACHVPPLTYTSPAAYDVGLADERGQAKFNPPSLRGIGHSAGYFHDRRAATLRDAFTEYGHQLDDPLTSGELEDLLRFLRSL